MKPRLLLASDNKKKRAELLAMLGGLAVEVVTPSEIGGLPPVDEDRPTFAANAAKKARSGALASGLWCLADDSGLEVAALGGAPGVLSARYAGRHGDDAGNNAKLLADLRDFRPEQRAARFVCALALARPDGELALAVEASASGRILEAPRGTRDFGYDPLFLFTELGFAETGRGFAELEPAEKARVSHRGRAMRALLESWPAELS
ncbi:MAG TPA: non-canonical purine NTP pyrophosphatase [Planctomycetota bacterium]|nr:non-canonical purine NTP pyrophosphatase [Planctomycetota bacterium]